jgi:hypothetical protein
MDDVTSSVDFLSRIQLYGSKSNPVVEGLIPGRHYGIPVDKDKIIDLGQEVDVVILAWRPKALSINEDPIIESFDPNTDTFKEIMKLSAVKDSGAMYGPEFLLYIPKVEKFCTLFMNNKTARREAKNMEPLLRHAATLKSRVIKQNNFVWDGIVVVPCSTPLDLPDVEVIQAKTTQFLNPPQRTPELNTDEDDREQ